MSDVKMLFTEDHEFVRVEGDVVVIGISNYAQEQLGDVVFVELPEVGKTFEKGDELAVVESVKAASEIYAPVAGEVTEINGDLEDTPSLVNEDSYNKGWFLKLKISGAGELDSLMTEDAYKTYLEGLD